MISVTFNLMTSSESNYCNIINMKNIILISFIISILISCGKDESSKVKITTGSDSCMEKNPVISIESLCSTKSLLRLSKGESGVLFISPLESIEELESNMLTMINGDSYFMNIIGRSYYFFPDSPEQKSINNAITEKSFQKLRTVQDSIPIEETHQLSSFLNDYFTNNSSNNEPIDLETKYCIAAEVYRVCL